MRTARIPFALLLLGCAQARPAAPPPSPTAEQARLMDRIEAELRMPRGALPLADYGRYYAWGSEDGRRRVAAVYCREENPRRHWVAEDRLPAILDGGCNVVRLRFDVAADKIEWVGCNGVA
jgi:hypothetical protein